MIFICPWCEKKVDMDPGKQKLWAELPEEEPGSRSFSTCCAECGKDITLVAHHKLVSVEAYREDWDLNTRFRLEKGKTIWRPENE